MKSDEITKEYIWEMYCI